mmetsp:Transcript_49403/g.88848  ORF Transcript_49403/g.88848 Transcript_49403/m.88848 type:complete len:94 (+) Transcript_49403:130-411(+)
MWLLRRFGLKKAPGPLKPPTLRPLALSFALGFCLRSDTANYYCRPALESPLCSPEVYRAVATRARGLRTRAGSASRRGVAEPCKALEVASSSP